MAGPDGGPAYGAELNSFQAFMAAGFQRAGYRIVRFRQAESVRNPGANPRSSGGWKKIKKNLAKSAGVRFPSARAATNDPFVYRLGLQIFILARRVRLPYGSPFYGTENLRRSGGFCVSGRFPDPVSRVIPPPRLAHPAGMCLNKSVPGSVLSGGSNCFPLP